MAIGAQAAGAVGAVGTVGAAETLSVDLDGLGGLVVAAGDRLTVAVAGLVLAVVHPAEPSLDIFSGFPNSLFGIAPGAAQALGERQFVDPLLSFAVQVPGVLHDVGEIVLFHVVSSCVVGLS